MCYIFVFTQPCIDDGIIFNFKNETFTEYLVVFDTNDYMTDDEAGDKLSLGGMRDSIKREIVYVQR